jgi:hypothetical protein
LLAGALQGLVPGGLHAIRLAAAILAIATEVLFYCALATTFASPVGRIAATAMLTLGGMTYARFVSHLYGVHLNNSFILASLLLLFSDLQKLPRRTFIVGLCMGVGYWVSPFVWVMVFCIAAARSRQWNELRAVTVSQLFLMVLGFAMGALPRIVHSYTPDGWYAPYDAGGFALAHVGTIPERMLQLGTGTLPWYFYGQLSTLGIAGTAAMALGFGLIGFMVLRSLGPTWNNWRLGRQSAFVPTSVCLLAAASVALVALNRRVFDSGYRYIWPVQFAVAVAWSMAIERFAGGKPRAAKRTTMDVALRGFYLSCLGLPLLLGALSLFLAERWEAQSPTMAVKRHIAEQALSSGCQVGVADYWYAYSLSLLTEERLRLAPIYTPRISSYARAAGDAITTGKRYCAILDLSDQAQATEPNRVLYRRLQPTAEHTVRFPGAIVLLVLGPGR